MFFTNHSSLYVWVIKAMCASDSNCGRAANLIGSHFFFNLYRKCDYAPYISRCHTQKNTSRLISWITSRQPRPKNVSRTLLPRRPHSIEYSAAKKSPPEPFGVTKLSEKGWAWPCQCQATSALLPHSQQGPYPLCAPSQDDKGKKLIEEGPSDAPVHALDPDIYNPLSYNGPTNTPMLQLSEDAAQAPF
jgi:hypothetical protein